MKVSEILEQRREQWQELERLCEDAQFRRKRKMGAARVVRLGALYRAACADLALADAYQLPPNTIQYLHRLVGRAHNQLYRTRNFHFSAWADKLLYDAPQRIFNDRCVQLAFCIFWGTFLLSFFLAYSKAAYPDYADGLLGREFIDQLETNFSESIRGRDPSANYIVAAFYIQHNTGIGLKCFASGLLVIPGLFMCVYNAAFLGGAFGYMARPDVPEGINFFHFVTAHGPFELTAIVLAAGSGLRLGWGWIHTRGLTRLASLRKTAEESMPMIGAMMVLFFLAALIEGFLSPSAAPWAVKGAVAIFSSGALMFYFVILGFPRSGPGAIR
ncbi:MAG: stage II sporulation protein M [Pirellulaceae bacterium]